MKNAEYGMRSAECGVCSTEHATRSTFHVSRFTFDDMETRIRPTLVIGLGQWGGLVAAEFERRVARRAGHLPVVRAVPLGLEGLRAPELESALQAELEHIRRLDAVQAARQAGWIVEGGVGSSVVLVASLGERGAGQAVPGLARQLRERAERDLACQAALSAVLLWPRPAGDGDDVPVGEAGEGSVAIELGLFDEGCCLLGEVNADGLLVASREEQARLVGNWLALWAMTPLPAALDRMPPGEAGGSFDTFGLAAWQFPVESLTEYLARRWQWEVLGRLLAPAGGDQGAALAFLERCGLAAAPWSHDVALHFRVRGEAWATPALDLVPPLRQEIDGAVEAEWARLEALVAQAERALEPACRDAQAMLAVEMDTLLDGPGLGVAGSFLPALAGAARLRATQVEREAERCAAHGEELAERAEHAGRLLDELAGRFPSLRWRTLLGLALRPWRLLHLWLLYREIGRRAASYVAYRQAQWLLQAEFQEHRWLAAFYTGLVGSAEEEQAAMAQLRARLETVRNRLAPDRRAEQALARRLAAAALPAGLAGYFFRQACGDGQPSPAGLLALYGPLSRWVRQEWGAETLASTLSEHAREQFAFLAEVRLDELLARTYGGAELRRRLAALVDAAAPWWAWDEPALSAGERAGLRRLVLAGLPDAGNSLLVDLLPERPACGLAACFSTGDRHQVVVAQVLQGLPLTSLLASPAVQPAALVPFPGAEEAIQPPCVGEELEERQKVQEVADDPRDVDRNGDAGGRAGRPEEGVAEADG